MNKRVYLGVVNFKNEDQKFLRTLLIFTPIPLVAQEVWSLNQFVLRRMKESLTLTYTPFHNYVSSKKFYIFLPLYIIDYLIGLAFWDFPIGL